MNVRSEQADPSSRAQVARLSLLMSKELLAIVELLETRGIPVLPFKGPVLGAAEYGDVAARRFCDLDVLVRREDVARAKNLLMDRGYVPEYDLEPAHERAWLHARNDINLRLPDLDITVELHWEVVPGRLAVRFDNDRLWAQARTVSIGARQIRTFSAENLLLVLCVHGAKHRWSRLTWVCDVAVIVTNHPELDWADLFNEARRMGVERMLKVALRLASEVTGCPLPEHVRRASEDAATLRLVCDLRDRLCSTDAPASDHPLERSIFHLKIRERCRDKVRFAFYTLLVPSAGDRLLVGLPACLAILYYFLRPFRLARKYAWRATGF